MTEYLTHTIQSQDTIQLIATRYSCDWKDIVKLNDLKYPFISDNTFSEEDSVAHIGSTILIPIMETEVKNVSSVSIENRVYGSDIRFTQHSTHISEPYPVHSELKDISIVKGVQNLYQACCSRFTVDRGSLVLHPEYGTEIRRYIRNGKGTHKTLTKIKLDARRTLLQDKRIEKITDLDVSFQGGVCRITANIHPVKPLGTFKFSFEI